MERQTNATGRDPHEPAWTPGVRLQITCTRKFPDDLVNPSDRSNHHVRRLALKLKHSIRSFLPRAIRAHRILRGPLTGKIIVTSLHDYPGAILGWTEKPLLEWFSHNVNAGETWLDVGAHYGYTAMALTELVGSSGRVCAFEPSLTTAGHLNRTRTLNRLNQLSVIPLGLSDSSELHVTSVPIDRGMANHSFGGADWEQIYTISFDSLRAALCPHRIDGVKIDVQGMELSVLVGMRWSLSTDHPKVIVEFHAQVDRQPILDVLGKAGYRLPGEPIEPGRQRTEGSYYDDRSYFFD